MSHGHNTVSNGTNPATDFTQDLDVTNMVLPNHRFGHVSNNSGSLSSAYSTHPGVVPGYRCEVHSDVTVNLVPYLKEESSEPSYKPSYARIAQSVPSQSLKQNLVAVATSKGDQAICDNSVNSNSRTAFSKNNSKGNNRSASRLGNVNVNVAEIMHDLERADCKLTDAALKQESSYQKHHVGYETGPTKFLYSSAVKEPAKTENQKNNVLAVSQVSQKRSKVSENKGHAPNSQGYYQGHEQKSSDSLIKNQQSDLLKSQSRGHSQANAKGHAQPHVKGHGQPHVKGQNFLSDSNKSDIDLDKKGQSQSDNNNNNSQGDGEVKKKKRRRRRRKKKTGEVIDNNDDNAGASEEITLHFEDDEEFPDLTGGGGVGGGGHNSAKSSLFNATSLSYSDIITNSVSILLKKNYFLFCITDIIQREKLQIMSYL